MNKNQINSPARIISASRRTDIPAFYAEWFMNRVRAGYCLVPNPFNRAQISRVSLRPEDVDVIVFWTRNPRPLLPYLNELDRLGLRYYFQYTIMDNPRWLDAGSPPVAAATGTFRELAERIGPQRLIWRYDPLVFTGGGRAPLDAAFHRGAFERIAAALSGSTQRVAISVMDAYPKAAGRMRRAVAEGSLLNIGEPFPEWFTGLIEYMLNVAHGCDMEIVSCAEPLDLRLLGVRPGKCVDDEYITRTFGLQVSAGKDPSQRGACGCVLSKDIGVYNTCPFGCAYCYATHSFETARRHHRALDPGGEAMTA